MSTHTLARTLVRLFALLLLCLNVSAFSPSSGFGQLSMGLYDNCTGSQTFGPPNLAAATAPQINPALPGWEQWTYFVYLDDDSVLFLRWNRGDPASPALNPWNATFELVLVHPDLQEFSTVITEQTLEYQQEGGVYELSIGGNSLIWDEKAIIFNITLNINGVTGGFMTTSMSPFPMTPAANHVTGQLATDLFSTVSVIRGHRQAKPSHLALFNTGYINFPSRQIEIQGISSIRHTFSARPIQDLVATYSCASTWSVGLVADSTWGDTVTYYTARPVDGSFVDAGSYTRATETVADVETFDTVIQDIVYSVTNQPDIMDVLWDLSTETLSLSFPGCALTQEIPYLWYSSVHNPITSFMDSAGGMTTYYNMTLNSTVPYNGEAVFSYGLGIMEVYYSNPQQDVWRN